MRDDADLLGTALRLGRMNAFEWDLSTDRVVRAGDTARFLGIDDLGDTGAAYFALVHPDDRERMQSVIASLTPEEPEFVHEYRVVTPAGALRWVQDSARGEFADGKLVRLRGLAIDITARRLAEGRLALVAAVSELIGAYEDPGELLYEVSRALGEHLHVRRCLFTEIDLDRDRGIVRRDYCRDVPSVAGVYKVSDYPESTRHELEEGRIVVNEDAKTDPRTASHYEQTYEPTGERAYIAVPLLREGRWVAELWISDDMPRHWSAQDVALLQSVAERVWTAVEKLRVHAALRESEGRVQFVGERANVGYWDWDVRRDRLFWSPVSKQLFGVTDEGEITYARFLDILHPDDRLPTHAAVQSALEGGDEYDVEFRAVWPDGSTHWLHARGSASLQDGTPVRMAGIVLDVTDRKALEFEREQLLVRERRLRAEADEANRAKDHFLALVSHELRTPMTTILGWASFLGEHAADAELVRKGIDSIEQASRIQARLIDDLLDVSRTMSGKLTLERKPFELDEVIRRAFEAVEAAARANGITLMMDLDAEPARVDGDAMRIQQVIGNLLSNAVKFTPGGGRVTVTVRTMDEEIEVRVRDTGIGIDRDFLPHVFDAFRQAEDGPSRSFGGLGIGLSIVRTIVELHGGTIEARSEGAGQGAEFVMRLARARE
ncbi:MAG: PAS domain-containing protein [Acidobacteriota bacterium]|nr:PAS domain-containing protein [Acidobacteriota bacterium]